MYLLFSDPNQKPVMQVESLNTAISLSVNCGYGILHESDYRPASFGVKSHKSSEPEVVNLIPSKPRCSNCRKATKRNRLTMRHSLKGSHLLCPECMTENEEASVG